MSSKLMQNSRPNRTVSPKDTCEIIHSQARATYSTLDLVPRWIDSKANHILPNKCSFTRSNYPRGRTASVLWLRMKQPKMKEKKKMNHCMSKWYLCIGTWHRLCMFLFLVHMLFADHHQGHQTAHFHTSLEQGLERPPSFQKEKKKKKFTWIYILKGHCQVRSIKCFFSYLMASFSKQQLLPISDAHFCLDTPVCALSLHETFSSGSAPGRRGEYHFKFWLLYHISSLYIYLYIYLHIYLIYICVCKYSYIKDFCSESLLWRYGGDVLLFSSVSGTSLGGTAMAERRASLLLS